jgi:hypothetical protein
MLISLTTYSQTTNVPDDNFEQAFRDLGYDNVLDDYFLTANTTDALTWKIYSYIIDNKQNISVH